MMGTLTAWTLNLIAAINGRLEMAKERSEDGDISITTVIIWVAAVGGAVIIAGTIALVITKYDGQLSVI